MTGGGALPWPACRPQLQWPKASTDARRRGEASRALLQGWMMRVEPAMHAATGPQAMVQVGAENATCLLSTLPAC